MAERQYGTRYEQIRADHMGRYEWAAGLVEGKVIDAACGCGYGAHYLAEKAGVSVHAIDVSHEAIDYARLHWPHDAVRYWPANIEDALLEPSDWIVSFETIEHLRDPEKALMKFADAADHLLVSVPNELNIPFDPKRFPFHMRHYTPKEFRALLQGAGWKVRAMLTQADAHTRVPDSGMNGRTLVAICEKHG